MLILAAILIFSFLISVFVLIFAFDLDIAAALFLSIILALNVAATLFAIYLFVLRYQALSNLAFM